MTAETPGATTGPIGDALPQPSSVAVWHDALRLELEETLHEGYAGVARYFDQMQNLFEDVVCDLNQVLAALNAPTPDAAPDKAAVMLHLVTVLQFEDIASQILQRARSRLALLEGFTIDMLFGPRAFAACQRPGSQQGESRRELREQIEHHRDRIREVMERGVRQQSMAPGDVVLF